MHIRTHLHVYLPTSVSLFLFLYRGPDSFGLPRFHVSVYPEAFGPTHPGALDCAEQLAELLEALGVCKFFPLWPAHNQPDLGIHEGIILES